MHMERRYRGSSKQASMTGISRVASSGNAKDVGALALLAQSTSASASTTAMRRPKTQPELLSRAALQRAAAEKDRTKKKMMLVKVSVWTQSIWPVRALVREDETVEEVIKVALQIYSNEGRCPCLPTQRPSEFALYPSQFSFTPLEPGEKMKEVDTASLRNLFLRPKAAIAMAESCSSSTRCSTSTSSNSNSNSSSSSKCAGPNDEIHAFPKTMLGNAWYNKLVHCLLLPS